MTNFSNCIDRVGHQKKKKKKSYTKKLINTGNNSTYHEALSEEWIEKRY